jgi:hypothetical protein
VDLVAGLDFLLDAGRRDVQPTSVNALIRTTVVLANMSAPPCPVPLFLWAKP